MKYPKAFLELQLPVAARTGLQAGKEKKGSGRGVY